MPTVLFKKGLPNARKDMEFVSSLTSLLLGALMIFPGDILAASPAFRGLLWYGPEWAIGAAMLVGGLVQFFSPFYSGMWRVRVMFAAFVYWAFLLINTLFSAQMLSPASVLCLGLMVGSLRCCADLLDRYRA